MIKKMATLFFCISLIFLSNVYAKALEPIPCSSELHPCVAKIQQLPEARKLIETIQKEGQFRIIVNKDPHLTDKFKAYWDPINRNITVHYSKRTSIGSLIGSIVFEMHNALVNSQMNEIDRLAAAGSIDREAYIEQFERLEYKNSKDASNLVLKGIEKGIFPEDAFLPTYDTFNEHFYVQQEAGHSEFIGRNYDMITHQKTSYCSY